jgi:hypothetical protein
MAMRYAGLGDEVGEREVPSGPGVHYNHAKQTPGFGTRFGTGIEVAPVNCTLVDGGAATYTMVYIPTQGICRVPRL